jgi:hypothetical protein
MRLPGTIWLDEQTASVTWLLQLAQQTLEEILLQLVVKLISHGCCCCRSPTARHRCRRHQH